MDRIEAIAAQLAAAVVAGMIIEAAYRGETVCASDISQCMAADPAGETAGYFMRNAEDVVSLFNRFKADPELLAIFPGPATTARASAAVGA